MSLSNKNTGTAMCVEAGEVVPQEVVTIRSHSGIRAAVATEALTVAVPF